VPGMREGGPGLDPSTKKDKKKKWCLIKQKFLVSISKVTVLILWFNAFWIFLQKTAHSMASNSPRLFVPHNFTLHFTNPQSKTAISIFGQIVQSEKTFTGQNTLLPTVSQCHFVKSGIWNLCILSHWSIYLCTTITPEFL
jgi:hypothetical protein